MLVACKTRKPRAQRGARRLQVAALSQRRRDVANPCGMAPKS
jgi:hypothetical protein